MDPGSKTWPGQVRGIMLFMSAFFAVIVAVVTVAVALGRTPLSSLGWFLVQVGISLVFLFSFLRLMQWAYRVGIAHRLRKERVAVAPRHPLISAKWKAIIGVGLLILFVPSGAVYVFTTVKAFGMTWELALGTAFYAAFSLAGWILFINGRRGGSDNSGV
jgi:hypothetical protein